jgi:hypothetical protein
MKNSIHYLYFSILILIGEHMYKSQKRQRESGNVKVLKLERLFAGFG